MRKPLSLAIVGIDYPNKRGPGRRFELEICQPGEPVELRPEPTNQFDEHAVAVFSCRGVQLGYLASERAVLVGTLWRQGHETRTIFQALDAKVGWLRIGFDGEEPVLPPVVGAQPLGGADGFWPDDIYPDG